MINIVLPPEPDPRDIHAGPDPYAVSESQIMAIREAFPQVESSPVNMVRRNFWELFSSCAKGVVGYVKHGHILYIEGDEMELKVLSRELAGCRELEVRTAEWLHWAGSALVPSGNPSGCRGELKLLTPAFVPGHTSMLVTRKRRNKKKVHTPRTSKPRR